VGAVQKIAVGASPLDLTIGTGGIWVANSGGSTLTRIAPRDGQVRQEAVPAVDSPFGVAEGDGRVWAVGPSGELAQIDPQSGQRVGTTELGIQADALAAGFGAVWVLNGTAGTVTRVDVSSGQVGERRVVEVGRGPTDIAIGERGPWVTNASSATLVGLEPETGRVEATFKLRGGIDSVAVGEGAVWVADPARGQVFRVDPATRKVVPIAAGGAGQGADVAVGNGAVFYVNHADGKATRIDPASNRRVGSAVRVAGAPTAAIVAANALWVTDEGGTVARFRF
jgi:streptogramin lyase